MQATQAVSPRIEIEKTGEKIIGLLAKNWDLNSIQLFEMKTITDGEVLDFDGDLLAPKVQNSSASGTIPLINLDKEENKIRVRTCQTACLVNNNDGDSAFMSEGEACASTPSSGAETMDLSSSFDQTEDDSIDCQTPRASIFDPFAAGPEELALAPKKKVLNETRVSLRRQLNFDSDCYPSERLDFQICGDNREERQLFELLCKSFLELIISNQVLDVSTEELATQHPESPKTPTSLPLLTGIAETCPPAPRRPVGKLRLLDQQICRKLNFAPNST